MDFDGFVDSFIENVKGEKNAVVPVEGGDKW